MHSRLKRSAGPARTSPVPSSDAGIEVGLVRRSPSTPGAAKLAVILRRRLRRIERVVAGTASRTWPPDASPERRRRLARAADCCATIERRHRRPGREVPQHLDDAGARVLDRQVEQRRRRRVELIARVVVDPDEEAARPGPSFAASRSGVSDADLASPFAASVRPAEVRGAHDRPPGCRRSGRTGDRLAHRALRPQPPERARCNSAKLSTVVGSLTGPRRAKPTNAAIDVATPVIG